MCEAVGAPPYKLYVPRRYLSYAHKWKFPKTLLSILPMGFPVESGSDNRETAVLNFGETICWIHYLRYEPSFDSFGFDCETVKCS